MKTGMERRIVALLLALMICLAPLASLAAYKSTTLCHGMSGDGVKEIQEALIKLGFLKGTADGVFGNKTENAVRKFQKKYKLTVDGLVGEKTKQLILSKASGKKTDPIPTPSPDDTLFKGNYSTIKSGSPKARVKVLQKALIKLKYLSGKADGKYGQKTKAAVTAFQKAKKLKADGVAGKKTLKALEKAYQNGEKAPDDPTDDPTPTPTPAPDEPDPDEGLINPKISPPATSSVQLLKWYDEVKTSISNGQHLLVFEPSSGLSWTLRILARGRHCDAEPITAQDTRTMVKAFGGVNTWNQKAVYVKLPDGRWSLASTHDMPHDSGTIKDNDFNGHLCVHFLRTMEETKKYDPNYGVSNQETIRKAWKSMTGQDVTD